MLKLLQKLLSRKVVSQERKRPESFFEQRVYGAILGQAIGDALGSQTEFNKTQRVKDLGNTWGYRFPAFSDDTQMMLAICDTILAGHPYESFDTFMPRLQANFLAWDHGAYGSNNRSPGGTCLSAVRNIRNKQPWQKSGIVEGKGNGSAMRSSVIGAAYWKDPAYAFYLGCQTSVCTHNDWEAIIGSGAVALAVALAIQNHNSWRTMQEISTHLRDFERFADNFPTTSTGDRIFAVSHLAGAIALGEADVEPVDFQRWNGNDGKGLEAAAGGFYYNTRFGPFDEIIIEAANESRDSDSVAAIAGAIAGAYWGLEDIPEDWRERIEKTAYLHKQAKAIYQFSQKVNKEKWSTSSKAPSYLIPSRNTA